jgi:hypothetical protein
VVECRDVASFIDHRFDGCDLLWRSVVHDRTIKSAVVIKLFTAEPVTANQEDKDGMGNCTDRTDDRSVGDSSMVDTAL